MPYGQQEHQVIVSLKSRLLTREFIVSFRSGVDHAAARHAREAETSVLGC